MNQINLPPALAGMDTDELLKSRSARIGLRFIQAGIWLRASSTIITLILICIVATFPALAQGSILGNDASRPVSFARRCIDYLSWGMILYGVYGLGKGVIRGINGQQGWGS